MNAKPVLAVALMVMMLPVAGCDDSQPDSDGFVQTNDPSTSQSIILPPRYDADNPPPMATKVSVEAPPVAEYAHAAEVPAATPREILSEPIQSDNQPPAPVVPAATPPEPGLTANIPTPDAQQNNSTTTEGVQHIRLTTGVALAQTLPDGTAMSFAVTYSIEQPLPARSASYFWVIVADDGDTARFQQPMQMQSDTLYAIVQKWRPEREPFRCFMEEVLPDGSRRVISNSIHLIRT